MYKVYGTVTSRAFRVFWLLEELGEPYEAIAAKPGSDEVKALNTSGKVPVLVDGSNVISDSTAIMTYLADKHGRMTYKAGSVKRAQQDALTHAILDELDAVIWTATRHSFILPEDQRVSALVPSLKQEFGRNVERLSQRFVGPYLQGEGMTLADIILVHCLNWAHSMQFPTGDETLKAYTKIMRARDAFKRAQQ